ncbi:PREDICTED: RNA demethylase ALKBH5-like [Chinchilla lanigera]|uniref:RNA demethylase ALKBH5-like n=1 Tax=Chinchilla lanigera TaxID=34839 RepID=UPI000697B102|nr:PREDICTED: RNA demethylase ALKBH5-like [Chinchilla lanigera]
MAAASGYTDLREKLKSMTSRDNYKAGNREAAAAAAAAVAAAAAAAATAGPRPQRVCVQQALQNAHRGQEDTDPRLLPCTPEGFGSSAAVKVKFDLKTDISSSAKPKSFKMRFF